MVALSSKVHIKLLLEVKKGLLHSRANGCGKLTFSLVYKPSYGCVYTAVLVLRSASLRGGVPVDPTCPLCLCEFESIIHALRDCRIIRNIWTQLGAKEINSSLFNGTLQHWITTNEKIDTKKHRDHPHGKPPSFSQFGAFGSIGTMLYSTIKPSNKTWVMRYSEKLWSTSIV